MGTAAAVAPRARAPGGVRIARNDPTLAHAIARRELDALQVRSERLRLRLRTMSVAEAAKAIRASFGSLQIHEDVDRLHGSRARGSWLVLDTCDDIDDLGVTQITVLTHGRFTEGRVVQLPLTLTTHAIARFLQRTAHLDDLRSTAGVFRGHVADAGYLLDSISLGADVVTAEPAGALIWTAVQRSPGVGLRALTWIAADTAGDPRIRAACALGRAFIRKPELR